MPDHKQIGGIRATYGIPVHDLPVNNEDEHPDALQFS